MTVSILYRGHLSSCNYGCNYCPFAKTKDTKESLLKDKRSLEKFVRLVDSYKHIQFKIFFTPWGEALIRSYYQQLITELSHYNNVEKIAVQTNLSCNLQWLKKTDTTKIALWTTYHPGETNRNSFLHKCKTLDDTGVTYSVGIVGFKEVIQEIETIRELLPSDKYVWINALKKQHDYYTSEEKERLIAVDPYVTNNMVYYESKGKACKTGHTVISVDGDGTMFRCHFIKEPMGNIYEGDFTEKLYRRPCTNNTCSCHIGYVHMDDLKLYDLYKGHELERVIQQ